LKTLYPVSISIEEVEEAAGGHGNITSELLRVELTSDAHHAYDARELALGEEVAREVERRVVLSVLDRKWREHLYEMDYLQEGIGLRAMAQRDPLVEYQREGFLLFEAMNEAIKEESIGYLFNVEVEVNPEDVQDTVQPAPIDGFEAAKAIRAKGLETPAAPARLHYSAPSDDYSVQESDEVSQETRASRKALDPRGGSKKSRAKSRNKRR
jgi:preprotein translocase subunit SecA